MTYTKNIFVISIVASVLSGCIGATSQTSKQPGLTLPEPRQLGKNIPSIGLQLRQQEEPRALKPFSEPVGSITISQALALALMNNPELAAFSLEMRAAEADILQSGLLPNPELSIEVENFGGSGELRSFDSAETTFQMSQLIELGSKRTKRTKTAKLRRTVAGWDYENKRLEVLTQTAQAAYATIAAQKRLSLMKDSYALAERVLKTASERVKFGKVALLEKTKARVLVSTSRIELEKAKKQLEGARLRLAATWGGTRPKFLSVQGAFGPVNSIPSLESLRKYISDNPEVELAKSDVKLKQSSLELEQARNIPDVTVNAGIKRIEENNDRAFVLGFSVPVPFFGINPGSVQEAQTRIAQSRKLQQAKIIGISASLSETYQALSSAYDEIQVLTKDVLPGAEEAFAAATQGYEVGKFGFLQVLDAQRTLFETRKMFIDAVATYHQSKIEVERLIGRSLDKISLTAKIPPKEKSQ